MKDKKYIYIHTHIMIIKVVFGNLGGNVMVNTYIARSLFRVRKCFYWPLKSAES